MNDSRKEIIVIRWSNNQFNNLHVMISLETEETTTCAAESSLMCCDLLKSRLLKLVSNPYMTNMKMGVGLRIRTWKVDGKRRLEKRSTEVNPTYHFYDGDDD